MDFKELKRGVSMKYLVENYCKKSGMKYTGYFRQKMRGIDGNGKNISFSEDEMNIIRKALGSFLKKVGYTD